MNAKTIGLLLILCLGVIGSPALAQSPTADTVAGAVDSKKQANEFLRRARLAMKGGNLELAERFILQSEKLGMDQGGLLSRFSDSPAKARKDLGRLKSAQAKATGRPVASQPGKLTPSQLKDNVVSLPTQPGVQARAMMAQAKAAFDHGALDEADKLVRQAAALQVPDVGFSGGDTPWELNMKIQKQRRMAGTVAPVVGANGQGKVAPAVFDPTTDQTYVRQVAAEEPLLPGVQRVAQQLPGLNPLMQQPAPVTLQTQGLPGTGITVPGGSATRQPHELLPGPATSAPTTISPAPPATTFQASPESTPIADPGTFQAPPTTFPTQPVQAAPSQLYETQVLPQPTIATPSQPYETYTQPGIPSQTGITAVPGNYGISPQELIKMGEEKLRDRELEDARDYFRQAFAMQDQLDATTKQRLQDHLQLVGTDLSREGKESSAEEREEAARLSRMLADVSREQMAINRELKVNPKVAWEKMKTLREKLDDADLPNDTRRRWMTKLDKDTAEMERYIETNRGQIELDERNREVLAIVDRERRMRVEVQDQLASTVEEFNTLMDQQRYSEAYVVARQAREIAPRSEITESMIWKSRFAERMYVNMNLRDRNQRMFEYANDSSELGVEDAYLLTDPYKFPKDWETLRARREGVFADGGSRFNETEQAIERALLKKVQVQFDQAPLGEVIETLGRMTGVNVYIDNEGLAAEGVTTDTPVSMNLSQEISLRSVLNLILGPYRLGYVIQDEVLRITSETARAGDVYTRPYYVGDLVIPIPNFMPGNDNALAGALAQAYSALGYGPGGFAQNRSQNAPLVIADNAVEQQNVGSSALAQMASTRAIPGMPTPQQPASGGASGADFDSLINLITSTVEPDSWDDVGGPGTVQQFDGNLSLVVSNTQEVHDAIVDLLAQLRRLQDLQVTIEVRFVTLQDNFFERIGVDFDFDIRDNTGFTDTDIADGTFDASGNDITVGLDPSGNLTADLDLSFTQDSFGAALPTFGGFAPGIASNFGFAILSDIEAFFLIEAIQGDTRTNVMQAPKVTLFNGQFANINDTSNRPFVTSVIPVVGDFAVAQQPVIMVLAEGTQLSVQAVVSSDRRFVRLTMLPMFSQIGDVDTFTFEGRTESTTGSSTETDPDDNTTTNNANEELFTEGTTVQLPNFATTSVSTTVSVPDGGTVLMGGIKRLAEGRTERGMPILSKLPYINRLFKNVGTGRETQTLMMMVTPRIIIQEEEEERVLATPSP